MEQMDTESKQPRRLHVDHDEATYLQRVSKVFHQLDVRTALASHAQVERALQIVNDHRSGLARADPDALFHATKLKHAIVHPDTGEKVFLPLRVSMIVPMNLILDAGMMSASTPYSTVFWQWLNQTYNALHYYANRNASNHDTATQRLVAYLAATGSSVGAALAVRRFSKSSPPGARWVPYIGRLGPFAAVAAADVLNLPLMRQSEFLKGVDIYDENGEFVGKSKRAGMLAVTSCVAGRVFAAAPILCIPPLIMQKLEQKEFLKRRPALKLPILLSLVGAMIQFSVPVTFGLFKQTAQVNVRYLEPEFRKLRRPDGSLMLHATYNKGI